MASKDQINSQYINEKVNPILEKLVIDLLIYKPEDSVFLFFFPLKLLYNYKKLDFMTKWLADKGGIHHFLFISSYY